MKNLTKKHLTKEVERKIAEAERKVVSDDIWYNPSLPLTMPRKINFTQ